MRRDAWLKRKPKNQWEDDQHSATPKWTATIRLHMDCPLLTNHGLRLVHSVIVYGWFTLLYGCF